jgi:CDP-diacylglycerol--glycerol-3-phosphate 3-phosphatidyltransferase
MFDGNLRFGVDRVTSPIGKLLVRVGVSADQITVVGLLMSVAAAVAIGMGRLQFGLCLLILTALPDLLDGAVAKAAGTSSKAELLGYEAKGGLMERAERMIVLGFGLCFNAILIPVLWVMLALTSITAVQRFCKVWSQATREISDSENQK